MLPNKNYEGLDLEFWANVKLLNQRLGYCERKSKSCVNPDFVIPTKEQIIKVFNGEKLDVSRLVKDNKLTSDGQLLVSYLTYRKDTLNKLVEPNLMDKIKAKELFYSYKERFKPSWTLPLNKQKDEKRDYAYLTGIINILLEANLKGSPCDYDPHQLTAITKDNFPIRTLSRRVDGAFPNVIDPIAIWEIKEYYYTTTFGSRVADGVYETQLDGWELKECYDSLGVDIKHYLFVDDYYTWWVLGRSYLCRLIDTMHMGLVTEVIFGKEVLTRLPEIIDEWLNAYTPKSIGITPDLFSKLTNNTNYF